MLFQMISYRTTCIRTWALIMFIPFRNMSVQTSVMSISCITVQVLVRSLSLMYIRNKSIPTIFKASRAKARLLVITFVVVVASFSRYLVFFVPFRLETLFEILKCRAIGQ
jgi:hypothetical protein